MSVSVSITITLCDEDRISTVELLEDSPIQNLVAIVSYAYWVNEYIEHDSLYLNSF